MQGTETIYYTTRVNLATGDAQMTVLRDHPWIVRCHGMGRTTCDGVLRMVRTTCDGIQTTYAYAEQDSGAPLDAHEKLKASGRHLLFSAFVSALAAAAIVVTQDLSDGCKSVSESYICNMVNSM